MQYSKLVEYLKSSRAMFTWTLDSENSIRGRFRTPLTTSPTTSPNASPNASPTATTSQSLKTPQATQSPQSPQATFTPITALCYMLAGKRYKSLEYAYAATELDIDLRLARAIELASDDVNCNSDGIMLMNVLHPVKI